jgi:bacteriocin-like protein
MIREIGEPEMNAPESEFCELSAAELDHVSGGFGALWNVTWMGGFFDVAKDAVIYAVSVAEDWPAGK